MSEQPTILSKSSDILRVSIAAAVLLASLSVAYYFAYFLPNQASVEAERLDQKERKALEQAKSIEERKMQAAENAKIEYDVCIKEAEIAYRDRWQASCKTERERIKKLRDDCFDQYGDSYSCYSYEIPPESDCTLPRILAQDYDSSLENKKKICLDRMRVASGQSLNFEPQPKLN